MAKAETLRGILLIEDNPDDFEATSRSFKKAGIANPLHWCTNDQDALDFLQRTGKYSLREKRDQPALILLDLNMPGVNGRAILDAIKQDKALRRIPVLVLTTSNDARDVERCYELGASTYLQKPVDLDGLVNMARCIREYWFGIAILPKDDDP